MVKAVVATIDLKATAVYKRWMADKPDRQ